MNIEEEENTSDSNETANENNETETGSNPDDDPGKQIQKCLPNCLEAICLKGGGPSRTGRGMARRSRRARGAFGTAAENALSALGNASGLHFGCHGEQLKPSRIAVVCPAKRRTQAV